MQFIVAGTRAYAQSCGSHEGHEAKFARQGPCVITVREGYRRVISIGHSILRRERRCLANDAGLVISREEKEDYKKHIES